MKNQERQHFLASYSNSLDIDFKDFYILILLTIFVFFTGIYSSFILDFITINNTAIVTHSINQIN